MPTGTKQIPSGITNGAPLSVTAVTTGTAQTVHTATNTAGQFDFLNLYVNNSDTAAHTLNIGINGTSNPIKVTVPAFGADGDGRRQVLNNYMVNGGVTVKVWADVTAVLSVSGDVTNVAP